MPEQYTINGNLISDGVERGGIVVQAFERDLPSLERRGGSTPLLLGDATTDAEGRFQINYTLEQFASGEAILQVRASQEKKADISFRVFDLTHRELNIRSIEAFNREFHPEQILFNVPNPLEVTLLVDAARESDDSEYEQLLRSIAPVIDDLRLTELTAEDLVFLFNELGLEQQTDVQQRLVWLRGSALLTQEISLPTEAFYGLARTGLPETWNELQALDNETRRGAVLKRIQAEIENASEESLLAHLTRAIEEHIIPSRFHDRVAAIAHAIHRFAQQEHSLPLRIERERTGELLRGYTVTAFDVDAGNRDLGTDTTNALGELTITYYAPADDQSGHTLRFHVYAPGAAEAVDVTMQLRPNGDTPVVVRVPVDSRPSLVQLRDGGLIEAPSDLLQTLEQSYGIRNFADIRRRGGLINIAELVALNPAVVHQINALSYLDLLTSDPGETTALLKYRYDSVFAIAGSPRSEFVNTMSSNDSGINQERATKLHIAAKAQIDTLTQIYLGMAIDSANGLNTTSR